MYDGNPTSEPKEASLFILAAEMGITYPDAGVESLQDLESVPVAQKEEKHLQKPYSQLT